MADVEDAVNELVDLMRGSPQDINSGRCGEFAHHLISESGTQVDGLLATTGDYAVRAGGRAHTWIVVDGRHYDAESPDGTDDWRDLPFFQRNWSQDERQDVTLEWDDDLQWYCISEG